MKAKNQLVEHDDDIPIGRVLTRRDMLTMLAGTSTTILLAACGATQSSSAQPATAAATVAQTTSAATTSAATTAAMTSAATTAAATTAAASNSGTLPTCVVLPELTEGPYFVDEKLNRSDIRSDPSDNSVKEGTLLKLVFNVSQVTSGACAAYAGAYVDIWHCDALGTYSDVVDNGVGFNTKGKKFLRGYHVTDANGKVEFTTIYPGWYQGRTVHIHFKVRSSLDTKAYTFTSQFFFDDATSDQIFTQAPYASKGTRTLKNSGDSIYRNGGSQLLLKPVKEGNGYTATFNIGIQKA